MKINNQIFIQIQNALFLAYISPISQIFGAKKKCLQKIRVCLTQLDQGF